jgi:hypothetical protein
MGIAAFVCLTVSYAVFEWYESRKLFEVQIGVAEFAEAGHCSNRRCKVRISTRTRSQRRLRNHTIREMSADQEKDKSKLHKLKIKGTRSATRFRTNLTTFRFSEACCGIRKSVSLIVPASGPNSNSSNTP